MTCPHNAAACTCWMARQDRTWRSLFEHQRRQGVAAAAVLADSQALDNFRLPVLNLKGRRAPGEADPLEIPAMFRRPA